MAVDALLANALIFWPVVIDSAPSLAIDACASVILAMYSFVSARSVAITGGRSPIYIWAVAHSSCASDLIRSSAFFSPLVM